MWFYSNLSRLKYPRSYLGKILLVSFLGVHVPLIGLVLYIVTSSPLTWDQVLPVLTVTLLATLFGTGMTLAALYALLSPVRAASRAVRDYLANRTIPALPTAASDEAGRLMADVQEGITRLDVALDAAEAARDRADENRREKFELLSQMSHELRTPLNHIIGFSEVMQHEMLGPLGQKTYVGYAGDINASGAALLELIQNVLDLSQIEAGAIESKPEPVDLVAVAAAAVGLKRLTADSRGVGIDLGGEANLPLAAGDLRAIKQTILQLISAAVAKSQTGSVVVVRIGRSGGVLRLVCECQGERLIRDDVPAAVAQVFEGDVAALNGTSGQDSLSQTGLALALSHSLARLGGGTIRLTNVAEGCRLTAEFPIAAAAAMPVARAA